MNLYCCRKPFKIGKNYLLIEWDSFAYKECKNTIGSKWVFSNSVPIDFSFNSKKVSQQLDIP